MSRRVRVSLQDGSEVMTELTTSRMYAGLASNCVQGAPPTQNLPEGFVSAVKSTAWAHKHHVQAVDYFAAKARTLKNWCNVPGNLHSVCGPKQHQSLFPLPLDEDDFPPVSQWLWQGAQGVWERDAQVADG